MDYTVLDLEMTGLAPKRDKVIEIGAVRVRNGEIADTYGTLVRPGMSIPETVVQLTGITDGGFGERRECGNAGTSTIYRG